MKFCCHYASGYRPTPTRCVVNNVRSTLLVRHQHQNSELDFSSFEFTMMASILNTTCNVLKSNLTKFRPTSSVCFKNSMDFDNVFNSFLVVASCTGDINCMHEHRSGLELIPM